MSTGFIAFVDWILLHLRHRSRKWQVYIKDYVPLLRPQDEKLFHFPRKKLLASLLLQSQENGLKSHIPKSFLIHLWLTWKNHLSQIWENVARCMWFRWYIWCKDDDTLKCPRKSTNQETWKFLGWMLWQQSINLDITKTADTNNGLQPRIKMLRGCRNSNCGTPWGARRETWRVRSSWKRVRRASSISIFVVRRSIRSFPVINHNFFFFFFFFVSSISAIFATVWWTCSLMYKNPRFNFKYVNVIRTAWCTPPYLEL